MRKLTAEQLRRLIEGEVIDMMAAKQRMKSAAGVDRGEQADRMNQLVSELHEDATTMSETIMLIGDMLDVNDRQRFDELYASHMFALTELLAFIGVKSGESLR